MRLLDFLLQKTNILEKYEEKEIVKEILRAGTIYAILASDLNLSEKLLLLAVLNLDVEDLKVLLGMTNWR